MTKKRAILLALVLPGFLAEVISGNTPLLAYLNPLIFILFALAYGLPFLLIREFAIRWRLSVKGVLMLGLAYGILNEGILAQTMLKPDHYYFSISESYYRALGVSWSYALFIAVWHSLHAMFFPLLIVQRAYSGMESWLSARAYKFLYWFLALVTLVAGLATPEPLRQGFIVVLVIMLALIYLARRMHGESYLPPIVENKGKWGNFILGFASISCALGLFTLTNLKLNFILFVLIAAIGPYLFFRILRYQGGDNRTSILLFGLGSYAAYGIFAMFTGNPIIIISNVVIFIIILFFAKKVIAKDRVAAVLAPA